MDDQDRPDGDLPTWQRLVAATIGVSGLGGGTTATFITNNSVGTGVLLAIGGLFTLIGVTGNPVARARLGDNEVTFGLRKTVKAGLDSEEPEVKKETAKAAISNLPQNEPVRRQAEGVIYEQAVIEALREEGIPVLVEVAGRQRVDAIAEYDGVRIGIEIKLYLSRHEGVERATQQAKQYLQDRADLDGMLIVFDGTKPIDTLHADAEVGIFKWSPQSGNARLANAVVDFAKSLIVRKL